MEKICQIATPPAAARPGPSRPLILISTYAEQDIADLIAAVGFAYKSSLSHDAIRDLLPGRGDCGNADDADNRSP